MDSDVLQGDGRNWHGTGASLSREGADPGDLQTE